MRTARLSGTVPIVFVVLPPDSGSKAKTLHSCLTRNRPAALPFESGTRSELVAVLSKWLCLACHFPAKRAAYDC